MTRGILEQAQDALASHDIPLADLSIEQYQALWASERWEIQPETRATDALALRTLVSAGLAEADESGVELVGSAAFIRAVCTSDSSVLWIEPSDQSGGGPRAWQTVSADSLLEIRPAAAGTLSFMLRSVDRAVRELARSVCGPEERDARGEATSHRTYALSDLREAEAFHAQIQASGSATAITYSIPDAAVLSSGPLRSDFHRVDGALIVTRGSEDSPGLLARSDDDQTAEVEVATLGVVDTLLRSLLRIQTQPTGT